MWIVLEHTDNQDGRRHYYCWSEEDLRDSPERKRQHGRTTRIAGEFDTEEESLKMFRIWSDDAET